MNNLTEILQSKPALHGHALRQWTNRQLRESWNDNFALPDQERIALRQLQQEYDQQIAGDYQNYKKKLAEGNIVEALEFAIEKELDRRGYNNRGVLLEYVAKAAFDQQQYALARELIRNAIADYQQETELGGDHCYQRAAERLQTFLQVQPEEITVFRINSTEDTRTIEGRIHPNLVSIIAERDLAERKARYLIYWIDVRKFPEGRKSGPEIEAHLERVYELQLDPLKMDEEASAKFALLRSLWAYIRGDVIFPDDKLSLPWCYAHTTD